jgi:hypothetical protein
METFTDEQKADRIAALTRELAGYETYGNTDRAKQVKAQLAELGADAATPQKRAAKKAKAKKKTEL